MSLHGQQLLLTTEAPELAGTVASGMPLLTWLLVVLLTDIMEQNLTITQTKKSKPFKQENSWQQK